jgi:hypothetical protein
MPIASPQPTPQPVDQPAPTAEFNALKSHLQTKYGLSPAQATTAAGSTPAATRKLTEQQITAWAKALPKGP